MGFHGARFERRRGAVADFRQGQVPVRGVVLVACVARRMSWPAAPVRGRLCHIAGGVRPGGTPCLRAASLAHATRGRACTTPDGRPRGASLALGRGSSRERPASVHLLRHVVDCALYSLCLTGLALLSPSNTGCGAAPSDSSSPGVHASPGTQRVALDTASVLTALADVRPSAFAPSTPPCVSREGACTPDFPARGCEARE